MQRSRFQLLLYAPAIFLSAFLLFLIQPLFAKLILPWFGGSAAVWTTCLVFFQVALLGGYLYAYLVTRFLSPNAQAALHMALLAGALFLLPAIPGPRWQPTPGDTPLLRLLLLLSAVLGLPFFLLSTTGPLLQAWLARRWPSSATYRLFAVSNAAALLALVLYPVAIEPRLPTRTQDLAWSLGFALFAVLTAIAGWTNRDVAPRSQASPGPGFAPLAAWFALAAGGSMLLLSTTNQLTQNVAAVPFLWILPLAVYLVTFILCFEGRAWYHRGVFLRLVGIGFASVAYMIYNIELSAALFVSIPVFLLGLFAGCMFCHGELSLRKPPEAHLTAFYLMIAAGGAAGAVIIGLLAPRIFLGVYELPLSMLCVAALALAIGFRSGWSQRVLWAALAVTMAIVLGAQMGAYHRNATEVTRDFYGTLRVVDSGGVRRLYHGTIEHGSQFLDPARRRWPTTYYGKTSGVGLALEACCDGPRSVGVIGLGAGTLAAYGRPGDRVRFYEIDPQVINVARSQFTFVTDTAASVSFALGDARVTLDREAQSFDILAIDAFSGDAIPVHLLTREAFAVYRRHLKPDGILAVHVSNQFLDLAPVVAQSASSLGMSAVVIESEKDEAQELASASWVLATCDTSFLAGPRIAAAARPIPARAGLTPWTDDYNDLLHVVRWLR